MEDEDVPVARRRDGPSGWSARGGKKCVEMASHVRVDRDGVLHKSSVSDRSSMPRDEKRERTYRDEKAADAVAPAEPLLGEEAQPGVVAGEDELVRRRAASIRRRELPQPRVDVLERRRAGRLLGEVEEGVDESRVRPGREGFEARKGDGRRLGDGRVWQRMTVVDEPVATRALVVSRRTRWGRVRASGPRGRTTRRSSWRTRCRAQSHCEGWNRVSCAGQKGREVEEEGRTSSRRRRRRRPAARRPLSAARPGHVHSQAHPRRPAGSRTLAGAACRGRSRARTRRGRRQRGRGRPRGAGARGVQEQLWSRQSASTVQARATARA